ncbi:MAG: site-2 protease family protein [Nitrospinae bacterium]|nr:site-2 protease family protein [Nitrospinota bacterium]
MNSIIQQISINAIPIILAIVLHEIAHGWVAYRLGDPTAKQMGRLTLNPIAHIDIVGTVILPLVLILTGSGFVFAYAKPVPVNFSNLRRPKEDMVWVAGAGPLTNILIAGVSAIIFRLIFYINPELVGYIVDPYRLFSRGGLEVSIMVPIALMLLASVRLNILLAVINLIPIPPADGGRILVGLLPYRQAIAYSKIEPIGMFLLFFLLFFDPLKIFSHIIWPIIGTMIKLFLWW